MKLVACEQGSDEWFEARRGKISASRIADVVAKTKSGYSASRANYMAELIAERLTGTTAERFTNAAMQWGTQQEAPARQLYELMTDNEVLQVGLVLHPDIDMACASPDGLLKGGGLIEIKAPNTANHIATLLGAPIDAKYIKQMGWQMACTGAPWCDYVSYDPRMPADMQIFIKRVAFDGAMVSELEREAKVFLSELDLKLEQLVSKYRSEAA